ncbi:Hypothetical predicted protein [Mytilus galloprovincialis]|uniref:Uncharacterized protein n=1 Tax=Mytilus galloprovincialis TaxID=29158 RepID=A0A8B6H3E1_MYTGA|nr:Hypothetical predicted protein [Mytilus galloprovincialis]
MACSGIVKPESKGYYSFPEALAGWFSGPASYPGRCRSKDFEIHGSSLALQQRLVSSPLSKDKLFSVSLEQLQEELNKAPPVVKVDVKVTDGKRFSGTIHALHESVRKNYTSPLLLLPVGGRLSHFLDQWALITSDKLVLSILRRGLELQFSGTASSFSCSNQSVSDKGFSKESVVTRRSEHSYSEGCVGGGQSSFSSRVLFPAVLGSQEERENETGSRSFCSQSVSSGPTFQNGDQQVYQVD